MMSLGAGGLAATWREGTAMRAGTLVLRELFGRPTGLEALSWRAMTFEAGDSPVLANFACDEVLYVAAGTGAVTLDGARLDVRPHDALHLGPGATLQVHNPGPDEVWMVSSRCPDPESPPDFASEPSSPPPGGAPGGSRVRWDACPPRPFGAGQVRVLHDPSTGCQSLAMYVVQARPEEDEQVLPYETVLMILEGHGEAEIAGNRIGLAPGTSLQVPAGIPHRLAATDQHLVYVAVAHPPEAIGWHPPIEAA